MPSIMLTTVMYLGTISILVGFPNTLKVVVLWNNVNYFR
jgi:hypothetical protein